MHNLIKFELYKLRHSKAFRNSLIMISGLIILNILMYFNAPLRMCIMGDYLDGRNFGFMINNFADKLHPTSLELCYSASGVSAVVEILVMFLVGAFVVDEYSNGTMKNIVAYGHKRILVYLSKILTISFGILILISFLLFGTAFAGAIITGWGGCFSFNNIIAMIKFTLLLWVILISMASIYISIATLIKSKSIVIGLGTTIMFSSFIFMRPLHNALNKYPRYTPSFMLMDICSVPPSASVTYNILITCSVLIIVTTLLGGYIFKKQDIK